MNKDVYVYIYRGYISLQKFLFLICYMQLAVEKTWGEPVRPECWSTYTTVVCLSDRLRSSASAERRSCVQQTASYIRCV